MGMTSFSCCDGSCGWLYKPKKEPCCLLLSVNHYLTTVFSSSLFPSSFSCDVFFFTDSQFPVNISAVKRDHDFLDRDLVEPLCRWGWYFSLHSSSGHPFWCAGFSLGSATYCNSLVAWPLPLMKSPSTSPSETPRLWSGHLPFSLPCSDLPFKEERDPGGAKCSEVCAGDGDGELSEGMPERFFKWI